MTSGHWQRRRGRQGHLCLSGGEAVWRAYQDLCQAHRASEGADMARQSKDQWIQERRSKFRCLHCGEAIDFTNLSLLFGFFN